MRRSATVFVCVLLQAASSGAEEPPPTHPVALIAGHLVELSMLRYTPAVDGDCPLIHLHPYPNDYVIALDETMLPDPAPAGCGYGVLGLVPMGLVYDLDPLFDNDRDGISNFREGELGLDLNNPDSDGDGVLDGNEDSDGDGLSNQEEIFSTLTDPTLMDSDGDGIFDAFDVLLDDTAKEFTVIPVLVNVFSTEGGPVVDPKFATDAVERANVVLGKGNIQVVVVGAKVVEAGGGGDDGAGGATAGDAVVENRAERESVWTAGQEEIDKLEGYDGAGMKVTFALKAEAESGSPGASYPGYPTVVVEQRASLDLTAGTIAHELGHALGIEGHPFDDSLEDTPEDKSSNFMNGSQFRDPVIQGQGLDAVEVTPNQVGQIEEAGLIEVFGRKGRMNSPAVLGAFQVGSAADARGDQGGAAAHLDLTRAALSSEEGADEIRAWISVGGLLPEVSDATASAWILFDRDASAATGLTIAGFPGIDRQVLLQVVRDPVAGLVAGAIVVDRDAETVTGLLPGPRVAVTTLELGDEATGAPQEQRYELRLPSSMLGLTADDVPVHLLSIDEGGFLRDTMSLVFHRRASQHAPTLTLFQEWADPQATVFFELDGFAPSAGFDLRIDGGALLAGAVDGAGSYAGSFVVPGGLAPGLHFLVALPESGELAFSALRVPQLPPVVHDDGSFEQGYGLDPGGPDVELVMRIDPRSGRERLDEISVCWTRSGASADTTIGFDLVVYSVAPNGAPGALLGTLPGRVAMDVPLFPATRFYAYDATALELVATAPIFVGPSWSPGVDQGFFLCADEDGPDLQPAYIGPAGAPPTARLEELDVFSGYRAMGIRARLSPVAGPCMRDARTACLLGSRYEVRAEQYDFSYPGGRGRSFPSQIQQYPGVTSETGQSVSFYSFADGNVEFFVKMNNGCAGFPPGHPLRGDWLWVTGATTAESRVEVTDTWTGQTKIIDNPKGQAFDLVFETRSFDSCDAAEVEGACTSDATTACLLGRYRVRGEQRDFSNPAGPGQLFVGQIQQYPGVSSETGQSVSFYSFADGNVEFFVKMNNGCAGFAPGNPLRADWLWVTGATTAESRVTVRDSHTGRTRLVSNAKGQPFALFFDTGAFPECDAAAP